MFARQRSWVVPLIVGIVVISADQASKYWIVQTLGPEPLMRALPLIGDWFRFIYSRNTGVAFSLFQGLPQFFTVTSLLICAGAIYFYWVHLPKNLSVIQLTLGLIIGGALGNVIDRIRLGYVVDFIQVGWWPVFNIADSAICIGAVLLGLQLARVEASQHSQEQAAAQ